jgi:hypothetical protein
MMIIIIIIIIIITADSLDGILLTSCNPISAKHLNST